MNREKIEADIKKYIDQSLAGKSQEYEKLDFKSGWHDLNDINGLAKFLKVTSAIANTPGLDGFIVYGYDDTAKTFKTAKLVDSGLSDSSKITAIINRYVQRAFNLTVWDTTIDGNDLSIIHLPPSIDKPHVISSYKTKDKNGNVREEKEKIFIRKGSNTFEANRSDIDFMYYDRKNIEPEYELFVSIPSFSTQMSYERDSGIIFDAEVCFENTGRRPIAIEEIELSFSYNVPYQYYDFISNKNLTSHHKYECYLMGRKTYTMVTLDHKNYGGFKTLEPNKLSIKNIEFKSPDPYELKEEEFRKYLHRLKLLKEELYDMKVMCFLTNGRIIHASVDYLLHLNH